jgi:hypothetical protein
MPDTVTCPRCFRNVPWDPEHWNAPEQSCTRCAAQLSAPVRDPAAHGPRSSGNIDVRLTGLDVPFGDLVLFMIRMTFASIPAGLLLLLAYFVVIVLLRIVGLAE